MKTVDNADVNEQIARVKRRLAVFGELLSILIPLLEIIMKSKADLEAEFDKAEQAVDADQAGDQAVVDGLLTTITDLQTTVADLQAQLGSQQDFTPFVDRLAALQARLKPVSGEVPVPPA